MDKTNHRERLQRLLTRRPERTAALLDALAVSQPTFSRLWAKVQDGVALGASRARQYALRSHVPGVDAPIPLFRVAGDGQSAAIGHIEPLQGGFYALAPTVEPGQRPFDGFRLFDGTPYFLRDLRPQGFLGPPGARQAPRPGSMQGEPPGSSAGGEQPKFTATVLREGVAEHVEHVIVKFSPQVDTPSGRRWGDLLICEHLALQVLARNGIAATKTALLDAGGRLFLEAVRVDRLGLAGRRPMATFSALDGDLGMLDQSWTAVAHELSRRGMLSAPDMASVEILDLYGALIGNTDRHHGNIAVAWAFDQPHRLLDAYDMLPMLYRPNAHGQIVGRTWAPELGPQLALRHLPQCQRMAEQFWHAVIDDVHISPAFKRDVAERHVNPLRTLRPAS